MKVERAGERRNVLGEGPHWDHRSSTLLYDDAQNGEIVRFDPQAGKETEIISLGKYFEHRLASLHFLPLVIDSLRNAGGGFMLTDYS